MYVCVGVLYTSIHTYTYTCAHVCGLYRGTQLSVISVACTPVHIPTYIRHCMHACLPACVHAHTDKCACVRAEAETHAHVFRVLCNSKRMRAH